VRPLHLAASIAKSVRLSARLRKTTRTNVPGVPRPPRLILRFALSTAVLLSIGAFVILVFVREHAISQAESDAVFHSRFVVRSVLGDRLRPSDFARPLNENRVATLDSVARSDILFGDSRALELYSPTGQVTYASGDGVVGTIPTDAPRALSTLTTGDVAKKVETINGRKVLKVFVPVPFVGLDQPAGVLALEQDYAPIAQAGKRGLLPVIGVLQLILLTLYVSLFPLLRRVTARLRGQVEQIEQLALYDALTGLANRRLFHDRLEQAFFSAQRNATGFSLMLLDLDRFKEINDTLGHQTGDAVLEQLASRLTEVARSSDTVARLGGDEFALVLLGAQDGVNALFVAERVLRALDRPFEIDGLSLQVETSIGIAVFPRHGDDAEQLLKHADLALYASKEVHVPIVYTAEHDQHSAEGLGLVGEVRDAVERGELVVHFQPEVDLATGQTTRVEALLRWNHPERGLLAPDSFIPLAGRSTLIRAITRFVLDAALRQCRSWQDAGLNVGVSVNVAPRDLADAQFEEEVADALRRWKVKPELLQLDIPESAVVNDRERLTKTLARLGERGVTVAVDDFGSGHASFSHLKQLPVDALKIDRQLVQNLGSDDEDTAIVRSTIELAHRLGLAVVAEGVESDEVLQRLTDLGCDRAQGFCLARPMPADDATRWLAAQKPVAA
jgi:diguanylate cyclase (GGDEF)-like protein